MGNTFNEENSFKIYRKFYGKSRMKSLILKILKNKFYF